MPDVKIGMIEIPRGRRETPTLPLAEAQLATLGEFQASYAAGCTFRPGDFVTPRAGQPVEGQGLPHVVLEVRPPFYNFEASDPRDTAGSGYGRRLDMRVLGFNPNSGAICAWWEESWQYQTYNAPHAES